jgi:hypothetical protein
MNTEVRIVKREKTSREKKTQSESNCEMRKENSCKGKRKRNCDLRVTLRVLFTFHGKSSHDLLFVSLRALFTSHELSFRVSSRFTENLFTISPYLCTKK